MVNKSTLTQKVLLLLISILASQLVALLFWLVWGEYPFIHFLVGAFIAWIITINSKKKTS